jgi:F420-0:gamma-glutamyl ligase
MTHRRRDSRRNIGVTHVLAADHLAAMATLVDGKRAGSAGASWVIGHTAPSFLLDVALLP